MSPLRSAPPHGAAPRPMSTGCLVLGYARVSRLEQNEDLQRDALTAAG
jgi:hypothetical protein